MSSVLAYAPPYQKFEAWAASYASSIKGSLATGNTGRGPMSTDVIIDRLQGYVTGTNAGYKAFATLPPQTQISFGEQFLDQCGSDYALMMACAKVALEHQDGVVASSKNDPAEVARRQTLLTATAAAQRCFSKHAYGTPEPAAPSHH